MRSLSALTWAGSKTRGKYSGVPGATPRAPPQGFKELDIELREDARLLEDLKRRISYFERDPLEKAEKEVEQVRAEVLQALFPAARAPEAAKPLRKTD